jgi:membrane-associated phospholipid phosphatase
VTAAVERDDLAAAEGVERTPLSMVVPFDIMRTIRIGAMGAFALGYLWWLRNRGLPIDRISVAISLVIFLVCAFVGRSWRTWAVLLLDVALYCAMWFCYEMTRGAADHLGMPLQVEATRNIDRFLFFGHDPSEVLQQHFWERGVRWYDWVASTTYMTHFVVPVIAMAVLWATSHRQWTRFIKRFATILGLSCVSFVLLPTAPPWMVARKPYNLMPQLHRDAGRGFYDLGFKGFVNNWHNALDWGNTVAAMPSLHASFALMVPAFFLPWIKPKWLKALALCFPLVMLTSLVYLGEHWVIDGIVGWLIVGSTFWFWNRTERLTRLRKAGAARAALGAPDALRAAPE